MQRVALVFGTRPEAVKLAPLIAELERRPGFEPLIILTAQHRQMLDQVLALFAIVPHYDLDLMRPRQTLNELTQRVLAGLQPVLATEKPDIVLVQGDTTTVFAAALAAFYLDIAVGHVEAGLRTGHKRNPFPEEINRRLTTVLADWHFCPTEQAAANLRTEGILAERIFVTGNTVIDALLHVVARAPGLESYPDLRKFVTPNERLILVTSHRRESFGEPMRNTFQALRRIVEHNPDVRIVFPVHLNPQVQDLAHGLLSAQARIHLIEPLAYEPFVALMQQSYLVLTDSGGIQEEAPALGKPVLVLRETTERPEAVAAGTARLVGTDQERIVREVQHLLDDPSAYGRMAYASNPFGDGTAARQIVDILAGSSSTIDDGR